MLPIIHQKICTFRQTKKHLPNFHYHSYSTFFLYLNFSNWSELENHDFMALLYLGIGGTIIGRGLWVKVTSELPTQITSGIYYLVIPLSIIFEVLFLNFSVTTNHLIGSFIILCSNLSLHYFFKKSKR